MHFQQCSLVRGLKRVMVFLLLTFLVCGEKEEPSVVGMNYHPSSMPEKQQQQHQNQLRSHPFGVFSQKRKVPNASDPLHNR